MVIYDKEVDNRGRLFGLDLLRASAITLVVVSHISALLFPKQFQDFVSNYFGTLGVELFFVLSGFLIGTILIELMDQQEEFKFKHVKYFWFRRWFRTLPNYYLILIICLVFYYIFYNTFILKDLSFWSFFVFLQNTATANPSSLGVAWSLAIEEWFYLLFPLGLLITSKFKFNKYRTVLIVIGSFIAIETLLRIFVALHSPNLDWHLGFRQALPLRLDSIAVGAFAGMICYHHRKIWDKYKIKSFIIGLFLLVISSLFFYFGFFMAKNADFFMKTFFFNFFGIGIALLFPLISSMKRFKNVHLTRIVVHISLISYSIYLIHMIIINEVTSLSITSIFQVLLVILLILVVSTVQYRLFEKPMTSLRTRFKHPNEESEKE